MSCEAIREEARAGVQDGKRRAHDSWAIVAIERCGALATGFPGGISDYDVVTPFPRPFADIASVRGRRKDGGGQSADMQRTVTQHDDLTIRDLYRSSYFQEGADPPL